MKVGSMTNEAPAADRERFLRDNAASIVAALEAKVKAQAAAITRLESTVRALRRERDDLRRLLGDKEDA